MSKSPPPPPPGVTIGAQEDALGELRRELRASLPASLREALAAYRRFADGPAPAYAKAFTAYQQGCRAALAHVQLLLNLAALTADTPAAAPAPEDDDLHELIAAARAAVGDDDADDA